MEQLVVSKTCIFNPAARSRQASFSALAFIPAYMAFPLGEIIYRDLLGMHGWHLILGQVSMLSIMFPLYSIASRRSFRRMSDFCAELRPALQEKYRVDLSEMLHVGISPGRERKSYSGDTSWDIGFMQVGASVEFYGDQCRFVLEGRQILTVEIVGQSGICCPRMYIEFSPPDRPKDRQWLSIEARGAGSRTEQFAILQRLRAQLALLPNTLRASNPVTLPAIDWKVLGARAG